MPFCVPRPLVASTMRAPFVDSTPQLSRIDGDSVISRLVQDGTGMDLVKMTELSFSSFCNVRNVPYDTEAYTSKMEISST